MRSFKYLLSSALLQLALAHSQGSAYLPQAARRGGALLASCFHSASLTDLDVMLLRRAASGAGLRSHDLSRTVRSLGTPPHPRFQAQLSIGMMSLGLCSLCAFFSGRDGLQVQRNEPQQGEVPRLCTASIVMHCDGLFDSSDRHPQARRYNLGNKHSSFDNARQDIEIKTVAHTHDSDPHTDKAAEEPAVARCRDMPSTVCLSPLQKATDFVKSMSGFTRQCGHKARQMDSRLAFVLHPVSSAA